MANLRTKPLLTANATHGLCVVSIGECMVEMAPAGQVDHFRKSFAGDTFNTAWYLKTLRPDWLVRYVTRVGRDAISADMVAMMDAKGIDTAHIQHSDDRTVGLYLISLNQGERSFAYWRDQAAARQLADDPAALTAATHDADVVFFSGITIAILGRDARATLLRVLNAARNAGKTIAFDPNLRPRLWADGDDMRAAIMAAAAVSDIVLPSFDEEAEHFGDADMAAVAARYKAAGAQSVIVKNGAGAVHFTHLGSSSSVTPDPLHDIVDTTSAGDSFNAGLFSALGHGLCVEEAILTASGVARQVISQRGALVPLDLSAIVATC